MNSSSALLMIDTSTQNCEVALFTSDESLFHIKDHCAQESNSSVVGGYCQEALAIARRSNVSVVAIAVTGGPGSYTGLRIGASIAKGLAYGLSVPLIAIPTLQLFAVELLCSEKYPLHSSDVIAVVRKASSADAYVQMFDASGMPISEPRADVITPGWVASLLQQYASAEGTVYIVGDTVGVTPQEGLFVEQIAQASIVQARQIIWRAFQEHSFVDVAYWQPQYVKPYQAVVGKNKILNR
ncbi:MAG: tRNA (adenosine(37)-N6)-threonylcarbamoyltransferase complex dimerization subunit type 1 TsaB [Porphyromonas sp.]|nr:tRNA (adenosine(37)-N6)-threonylcarbamoyltransferase complex dimerization subunit type 1 TsaB [Porphyromonas sp.]